MAILNGDWISLILYFIFWYIWTLLHCTWSNRLHQEIFNVYSIELLQFIFPGLALRIISLGESVTKGLLSLNKRQIKIAILGNLGIRTHIFQTLMKLILSSRLWLWSIFDLILKRLEKVWCWIRVRLDDKVGSGPKANTKQAKIVPTFSTWIRSRLLKNYRNRKTQKKTQIKTILSNNGEAKKNLGIKHKNLFPSST